MTILPQAVMRNESAVFLFSFFIKYVAPRGGPIDMDELKTRLISEKPGKFGAPLAREFS